MIKTLSKFERVFANIVKIYVKHYPENSFKFYFDDVDYPLIGKSKNVVTARFKRSKHVFKRIFTEGSIGLGESYCEGLIQVDDKEYKDFLKIFIRIVHESKFVLSLSLRDILLVLKAKFKGSFFSFKDQRENINSHYSLSNWFENYDDSNKFYLYWLNSKYIQYTCAKWDKDIKTLEQAQKNKFEFYRKRLGIDKRSKGKTLLDLGCGWGGLMFYLNEKYGVICNGITLSTAQAKYIEKEIKRRELKGKVSVENINAHDMHGKYDYVISVGLLEHIDDYDDLYKKSADCLSKGGAALFHAMFHVSRFYKPDPFLLKYIFPGGGTPNFKKNIKIFKRYFKYVNKNKLPDMSYSTTIDWWFRAFCKNEKKIRKLFKQKSKCKDIDYAIRIFKHYLVVASASHAVRSYVYNVLAKNS